VNATTCADLAAEVAIPDDGTISRTLYARLETVLFGFSAGQELSEHTASVPAVLHVLEGEAHVTLGEEELEARAGAWVHMPARLPHAIAAGTAVEMLLPMLR